MASVKYNEEERKSENHDEIDTQISEVSRDLKILEHRYQSNLAYLETQTQQLESYIHFMVL